MKKKQTNIIIGRVVPERPLQTIPFIVCTHTDRAHIHNHVIISAVDLDCNRKFRNFWGSTNVLRRLNDTLCIENGYAVVENPKRHGRSYNKWLGDNAPVPHRERIRLFIDDALQRHPKSFDALLDLLLQAGYKIKGDPDNPSLRGGGQKRFVRMDTLGPGYTPTELKAVFAGEHRYTPKERRPQTQKKPRQIKLASWSTSDTSTVTLSEIANVSSGMTYTLYVYGTINGDSFNLDPIVKSN